MACSGRVKFYLAEKGWGRLEITGPPAPGMSEVEAANGVFVHFKDIVMSDEKTLASLEEGQEVTFDVVKNEKGWQANSVKGVDGQPIRGKLHRNQLAGIFRGQVSHWNFDKGFGWIATDLSPQSLGGQRVPKSVLMLNEGRVYFRWRDCGPNREGQEMHIEKGKAVVFQMYWDEKGLGAVQLCDAITLQPLSLQYSNVDHYQTLQSLQGLNGSEQIETLSKAIEKVLICIVVSRSQAGSIIGKGGETVKAFKADTGIDRCFVENGMADNRQVELKGTPQQVVDVLVTIAEHLQKEPGGQQQAEIGPLEVRFVVPDEGFGRLVGKGKAQLTAIEEKCPGANITITTKVPCSTGIVQGVAVSGSGDSWIEALKMVICRIATCCNVLPLPREGQAGGSMSSMLAQGFRSAGGPAGFQGGKGFQGGFAQGGFGAGAGFGGFAAGGFGSGQNSWNQQGKGVGWKGGKGGKVGAGPGSMRGLNL